MTKKILALVLALAMVLTMGLSASAETVAELPRNESLYFAGQQWGAVATWNPIGTNQNNAMACTTQVIGSRTLMFETLYMYDILTGTRKPLLAEGEPSWNADLTELTIKLNPAAKWSDGTAVTSADVVKTWDVSIAIGNNNSNNYSAYIASIEAIDDA